MKIYASSTQAVTGYWQSATRHNSCSPCTYRYPQMGFYFPASEVMHILKMPVHSKRFVGSMAGLHNSCLDCRATRTCMMTTPHSLRHGWQQPRYVLYLWLTVSNVPVDPGVGPCQS